MNLNFSKLKKQFIAFSTATTLSLVSVNAQSATELSSRINLSLDNTGGLIVDTRYLSNYIMRGVDENTGLTGRLELIKRNEKAVDFDF